MSLVSVSKYWGFFCSEFVFGFFRFLRFGYLCARWFVECLRFLFPKPPMFLGVDVLFGFFKKNCEVIVFPVGDGLSNMWLGQIMKEDDNNWPEPDRVGRQELEIVMGNEHISFTTSKIGSLVDVQTSRDPEGLRIFYYLVQVRNLFNISYSSFILSLSLFIA